MNPTSLELLQEKIRANDLDSLLITKGLNTRYLTGFDGESAGTVISRSGLSLFVNSLYIEYARATVSPLFEIREMREGVFDLFSSLGNEFWGKRVGFEADGVTFSFHGKLSEALKTAATIPCEGMVEEFRERKRPGEIEAMRKAQRIAEQAFREVLPLVREGVEERELALEVDYRLRGLGGERSAFDTIVASGPNTSRPHAIPSNRKIAGGDLVLFDLGTVVDGYASDMTRTVVLGKADARQRQVYHTVLEAQENALAGITAGMKCADADQLARQVIERAGFGKEFVHTLGHGVGLEVHESPRLSSRSEAVLQPGTVVTVEPGIYLPDWGGIRIEDMVVVTESGCDNLTEAPKELMEL